ncbi:hypothetical protein [Streptomyces sp. NPDC048496]|uniref:hypothetical protein n=1 Tax=Streptomyces sp. NPDC048496 TaxID=3365558 RepID=UPI00371833FC
MEIVFVGLSVDRDEVEDALEAAFEDDGEITGAGGGMGQCHLDLEIEDRADGDEALRRLHSVLVELGVSESAQAVVRD